jgi:hypothetical protein
MRINIQKAQRVWSTLGGATPLIVYFTKEGAVMAQLGLMPEAGFASMMTSWAPARLGEFK